MAINNIQQRVERSIFEAIRKNIVAEGYLPDIANNTLFPKSGGVLTSGGQAAWTAAINAIQESSKKWAVEIFGVGSSDAKGLKRVPRVVIAAKRIVPGEIGFAPGFSYIPHTSIIGSYNKALNPGESANMHFEITLTNESAAQSRFLNAMLQRSLGSRKYVTFEDNVNERFFIRQYNYFDLPDTKEGIEENVYSYEVQDLYIFDDSNAVVIKPILEITTQFIIGYTVEEDGDVIGETDAGSLIIT